MPTVNLESLRALIAQRGLTPRGLSLRVSSNAYLVRDILSGRSESPRRSTIHKLAAALDTTPAALIQSEDGNSPFVGSANGQVEPEYLVVRYRVQAGQWFEVGDDEPSPIRHPVTPDRQYVGFPQWLEEVVGDSCDKVIRPGAFAHVVDAIELGYAPQDGDLVVVERSRDGGLRERTIKEVRAKPGGQIELIPRSTNPKWKEPLHYRGDGEDNVTVAIVGLVLGEYTNFRRRRRADDE